MAKIKLRMNNHEFQGFLSSFHPLKVFFPTSAMEEQTIGGVSFTRVLDRKDRMLQQLSATKPARYTEIIGVHYGCVSHYLHIRLSTLYQ